MRSTLLALILAAGHCLLPRLSAAGGADEPPRSAPGSSTLLGRSLNLAADWLNQERPRLQFINGSKQTVDIFWLKSATERVPNGSLDPGEKKVIPTTLGHQFSVVGRDDKTEAAVTSEVVIQGFRFDPPSKTGVPAFYTQSLSAEGFPIVASANVNPYALQEVAYICKLMLSQRPDVRKAMIKSGARLCIMAHNEFTTDLPEFVHRGEGKLADPTMKAISAKDFWDARARGTGSSPTDPYCTCAEENVLAYPGDPYETECILIHEFAHSIHMRGMTNVDATFDSRLRATFEAAMKTGLWKGKYASVSYTEYFAEGVQSWFDNNRENDHDHNHVNTRAELVEYDAGLAALCKEVFGETDLTYTKPNTRLTGHLAGYDPTQAPRFEWPPRLNQAREQIYRSALLRSQTADAATKGQ